MPHVSKRFLQKDTKDLIDNALVWVFSRLTGEQVKLIFDSLLTPTERLMLAKRLGILFLLKEETSQDSITNTLKVTQATISRINLQHKLISPAASHFLFTKLSNWKDFTAFKNALKSVGYEVIRTFSRGMAGRV